MPLKSIAFVSLRCYRTRIFSVRRNAKLFGFLVLLAIMSFSYLPIVVPGKYMKYQYSKVLLKEVEALNVKLTSYSANENGKVFSKEIRHVEMDATLQGHGAKHICRIPEGLRELCADISREVLRSQPEDIYRFIADYVDALLLIRDNAKVAVEVVNDVLKNYQSMVMNSEQIAATDTNIRTKSCSCCD